MVATATGYVVSPAALGDSAADPDRSPDRLSVAYVVALAGRVVRELGGMARNAAQQGTTLPAMGIDTAIRFASPADRSAFAEELTDTITRLAATYHDADAPDGRWQRVVVAVHPVPRGVEPLAP